MIISDESYERVRASVEDIKCCCEIEDDYMEWEDIAAYSIMAFLEALDEDQLKMTVAAFKEYAWDFEDVDPNFSLACVFCLGLWWLSTHRSRRGIMETMKAAVWLCLCNGCAWVWCSYLLAYLGREQIAEQLSGKAVTEIIAVILAYAIKSILENLSKHNNWPDRSGKKEETTHE